MVNQTLTDLKTNDTRIKLQHTRTQGTAVSEAMQRNNSSQPTETVTSDTILDLHCEKMRESRARRTRSTPQKRIDKRFVATEKLEEACTALAESPARIAPAAA